MKEKYLIWGMVGIAVLAIIISIPMFQQSRDLGKDTQTATVAPASDATDNLPTDSAAPNGESSRHTAQLAMQTMHSFNPKEDQSPADAQKRAERYLIGPLLDGATAKRDRPVGNSERWNKWAASGDTVTASANAISVSPGGENQEIVLVDVTQTLVPGNGGKMMPLGKFTVKVTLSKEAGVWLAHSYEYIEGFPRM